jgi:aryl-alcohol dehydrogenase-like predicted oxidoreductase
MTERALGTSGLTTPPLILGGNVFGWTADRKTSHAVLDAFVAGGGRMIDTADAYSRWAPGNIGGESESIIGEWLHARGRRDDVVIATKVGADVFGSKGLAPDRIARSVEGSLKRLRTDYIDLYFAHFDDPQTPLDATLGAFDTLVKSGKVRAIGASNYTAERLREALDTSAARSLASYSVLQPEYNLVARSKFEGPLQALCLERGVAAVPYFALASGFLTGKYRNAADTAHKARGSAAARHLNAYGLGVLRALDEVAKTLHATPAQTALAWLAAQPAVAAPIASATSVAQVDELLGAMRLTLTSEQLLALDQASRQPQPASKAE